MKNIFFYQTYLGSIGIAEEHNKITNVFIGTDKSEALTKDILKFQHTNSTVEQDNYSKANEYYFKETDILKEASSQIYEYFERKRKIFSIPLAPTGTKFMQSVWKCLCDINYGETKSYKDIAKAIGNEKTCRAVGQANNKNPIPIFIPCHRVIGSNGNLIGYSSGLKIKSLLLEIERQNGNI